MSEMTIEETKRYLDAYVIPYKENATKEELNQLVMKELNEHLIQNFE